MLQSILQVHGAWHRSGAGRSRRRWLGIPAPGDTVLAEARELRIVLPDFGLQTALATVEAEVAGEVRETPVAEGMPVARGQVVVRLDAADLRARRVTQQAAQDDASARLALARKNRENNLALLMQKFISQNAVDAPEKAWNSRKPRSSLLVAIMTSLPFSLIGVSIALLVAHSTLDILSIIGFIMLMGLVTKNAMLLVDFIN